MPQVPNVAGQVTKLAKVNEPSSLPKPKVETELIVPGEDDSKVAIPTEVQPEPAITPDQWKIPTQAELLEHTIATQTVLGKGATVESLSPSQPSQSKPPLTEAQRIERAKHAIESRWAKHYPWDSADIDDSLSYLAELRAEVEKGGITLQNRISVLKVEKVKCYGCEKVIELGSGHNFVGMRTRNNFDTGIPESAYACCQRCYIKLQREYEHPTLQPKLAHNF